MDNEVILKKSLFGGFDRKEVIDYINSLQKKARANENSADELEALRKKNEALESELEKSRAEIGELGAQLEEARRRSAELDSSDSLIKESMSYADSYIDSARSIARGITEKTARQAEAAEADIDRIMLELGDVSDKVSELYTSLEKLRGEYEALKPSQPEAQEDEEPEKSKKSKPAAKRAPAKRKSKRAEPAAVEAEEPSGSEDTSSIPDEDSIAKMLEAEEKYRNMLKGE